MEEKEKILEYMPKGWAEAARSEKALIRSREIKTAEELLLLNMLYLTEAGSYQNASILLEIGTGIRINKEAARKRIQGSWRWLKWLGQALCREREYARECPDWLEGRRVLLVDATDVSLRGSAASDYRLHYVFDLFGYTCAQLELTGVRGEGGEKLTRYNAQPGDIFVADRIYGTIKGMEYIGESGADYVVRLKSKAFNCYDQQGERLDLLTLVREHKPWEAVSVNSWYKDSKGELRPVRIVAARKDEDAVSKASRRLGRVAKKKQWKGIAPETQEMSEYIVLATSLEDEATRVLELYRARWQIERVFHRLKGLFSLGEPPGTNPDSVKAWFYGKLFLAALCEAMMQGPSFSPE